MTIKQEKLNYFAMMACKTKASERENEKERVGEEDIREMELTHNPHREWQVFVAGSFYTAHNIKITFIFDTENY